MTEDATDLLGRLRRLDTCVVSDALDAIDVHGVLAGLVPLWDCGRVTGRAHTVQLRPVRRGEDSPPGPHLGTRAIDAAAPGDVIVVANGGRIDSAGWGGLLSAAATVRGVAGVIVDGACRDVDEAAAARFPVFAAAATPVSARGRTVEAATDVEVTIAGVPVAPGDVVIADRSGVVVVPHGLAAEVADLAESLAARERSMLADLTGGTAASEVMDRRYESMLRPTESDSRGRAVDGGGGADAGA